jgi:hypothetical protein
MTTTRLRIIDSGIIYRNPLPGHQALSITHPCIVALSEKELLCSAKHGQAQYAADNMVHLHRSLDGGRTWRHEGPLRDRKKDSVHYQYSAGLVTLLNDGSLLMNNWRCDRSDLNKWYVNPKTGGSLPLECAFFRSTDGGRNWSEPTLGKFPLPAKGMIHAFGGPVVELANGEWLQHAEPWIEYDSTLPYDVRTYAMFSRDQGRTWSEPLDIANGMDRGIGYSHAHVIHLPDGRLFSLYWTMNSAMTQFQGLHWNASTDARGRKWTKPEPTGISGQSSYPVVIDDKRMAIVYSERDSKQPGIKVVLSHDPGRTWDVANAVVVWDAYGKEALGVPMTSTYPSSHDAIAYGAPHICRINEHELIASFWCTQSADTHARWTKIEVE